MSVLIKGLEMPNNCAECPLNHDAECAVKNCIVTDDCYVRRASWCPLVPVQPHGRLIKRIVYRGEVYNALEAARINALDGILSDSYKDGFHDGLKRALEILANVEDAPTIIPTDPMQSNASNTLDALTNACPLCKGTLSGLRRSGGHFIRHCYSCNFDFPIDKDGNAIRLKEETT